MVLKQFWNIGITSKAQIVVKLLFKELFETILNNDTLTSLRMTSYSWHVLYHKLLKFEVYLLMYSICASIGGGGGGPTEFSRNLSASENLKIDSLVAIKYVWRIVWTEVHVKEVNSTVSQNTATVYDQRPAASGGHIRWWIAFICSWFTFYYQYHVCSSYMFLSTICTVICLACLNIQLLNSVLAVANG